MTGDDAVRAVLARQLADALGHLAALLELIDRKLLSTLWSAADLSTREQAREFLEAAQSG